MSFWENEKRERAGKLSLFFCPGVKVVNARFSRRTRISRTQDSASDHFVETCSASIAKSGSKLTLWFELSGILMGLTPHTRFLAVAVFPEGKREQAHFRLVLSLFFSFLSIVSSA